MPHLKKVILFLGLALPAFGMANPTISEMPREVIRGDRVSLTLANAPPMSTLYVVMEPILNSPGIKPLNVTISESGTVCETEAKDDEAVEVARLRTYVSLNDNTSAVLTIPNVIRCPGRRAPLYLKLGNYRSLAQITANGTTTAYPLRVMGGGEQTLLASSTARSVKITGLRPLVSYPEDPGDTYSVVILGEGFSSVPEDNVLRLDEQNVPLIWGPAPSKPTGRTYATFVNTGQISISGIPRNANVARGKTAVRLVLGDSDSASDPFEALLSKVGRKTPRIVALAVLGGITLLLVILSRSGLGLHRIGNRTYGLFKSFFLDPETDTYSLSKLQFYVWTAVALFAYVYITVAHSLIRGVYELPPIPSGLPGIILISAGTTIFSLGITSTNKVKGSGGLYPSLSDFITSGGVVAADRVQFLVWTIIGAGGVLVMLLLQDPGLVDTVPALPNGFLQLMGISSAGYLGGKLIRHPGPIIDEIRSEWGTLKLTLVGRNLSKNATFVIDEKAVPIEAIKEIKIEEPESENADKDTAKKLSIVIKTITVEWSKEEHRLMLVNPDGQKATWTFKAPSPSVTKVELTPPTSSIEFRLVGSNLAEAGTIHIDDKEVAKDKHELTVTGTTGMDPLAPGLFKQLSVVIKKPDTSWAEKRNHKVLLTNPDKQTVQTEYTVS